MNLNINYLAYLYLLIPIFLITGPAVPDISLTLISLFGFVIFYKNFSNLIEIKTFKIFTLLFAVFYVVLGSP